MPNAESYSADARHVLSGAGWTVTEAVSHVGRVPGLYAIQAPEATWSELGIKYRAGIPLYIGKSETNLAGRELQQHFAIDPALPPQTGSSTVRRSFAALLHGTLELRAVPRNREKPERFANYGLEPASDSCLTRWMHDRLTLTVWPTPSEVKSSHLQVIEMVVIRHWTPPRNIRHNPGRLQQLVAARAVLAAEARAWVPPTAPAS